MLEMGAERVHWRMFREGTWYSDEHLVGDVGEASVGRKVEAQD